MFLLRHTLFNDYPQLYPHLSYLTETEIQNLPEDHFYGNHLLDVQFREFHTMHIMLLREIDERIHTLLNMKNNSLQFRRVLNDLQSRNNNTLQ